jgi:hypothetical protein
VSENVPKPISAQRLRELLMELPLGPGDSTWRRAALLGGIDRMERAEAELLKARSAKWECSMK